MSKSELRVKVVFRIYQMYGGILATGSDMLVHGSRPAKGGGVSTPWGPTII